MKLIPIGKTHFAKVDDHNFHIVNRYAWHLHNNKNKLYAQTFWRGIKPTVKLSMHRFIMNPGRDLEVDHIDGDGLNNCESNLRICTHAENGRNRQLRKYAYSGFLGVSWDKKSNKWRAQICINYKTIPLGAFENAQDAARARDEAALKYHGQFARLNFPISYATPGNI